MLERERELQARNNVKVTRVQARFVKRISIKNSRIRSRLALVFFSFSLKRLFSFFFVETSMLNNDPEMNRFIRTVLVALLVSFVLLQQSHCQTLDLDYSLYSHLSYELNSLDSSEIVNHYRLNKETIDPYSQYLHFPDR